MIYDLLANIGNYRGMNRNLDKAIDYLMIAKYFEKIGDHAVNISQWVLFMITGTLEEDSIHDILRGGRS